MNTHRTRVLVLGVSGMLGHKMFQVLSEHFSDTWVRYVGQEPMRNRHHIELFQSDQCWTGSMQPSGTD